MIYFTSAPEFMATFTRNLENRLQTFSSFTRTGQTTEKLNLIKLNCRKEKNCCKLNYLVRFCREIIHTSSPSYSWKNTVVSYLFSTKNVDAIALFIKTFIFLANSLGLFKIYVKCRQTFSRFYLHIYCNKCDIFPFFINIFLLIVNCKFCSRTE